MEIQITKEEFEKVKEWMERKTTLASTINMFEFEDEDKIPIMELRQTYCHDGVRIFEKIIFKDPVEHKYLIQY